MEFSKRKLFIKTIVNPQAAKSFALRFEIFPKKDVNLKIMLQSASDLHLILDEIKAQIPTKYNFDIQFNWKNAPASLKSDEKFQEEIIKIFHGAPSKNNDDDIKYASIIRTHVQNYGASPNFKKNLTEKNKVKIYNYIKTVLGIPNLTMEQSDNICKLLNSE